MTEKKKPEDYPLFTMRMSKEEKKRYDKLAAKHGKSRAELVREGLRVLEENPNFLDPTVNPYLEKIQSSQREAHQERLDYYDQFEQRLENVEQTVGNIERILEKFVTKGKPLTKKELKQAQKKDDSSEAIFE